MSTGNPNDPHVGPDAPGAGPQWPADASDARRGDDHGGGGGVNPAAIRAGHEPDVFAVRPILSIPAAVVITFVIAFAVAGVVFWYFVSAPRDPMANPQTVARNKAPLNERLDRINENPTPNREVDQPRLEPLQRLENNGQYITQPPLGGVKAGNSPELHPEDLRPGRIADPNDPGAGNWTEGERRFAGKIVEATRAAADSTQVQAALFPHRKEQVRPGDSSRGPSYSNAGRGAAPAAPHDDHDHGKKGDDKKGTAPVPTPKGDPPAPPKKDEPKKEEAKKEEAKKDEGKKDAPAPPKPPEKK